MTARRDTARDGATRRGDLTVHNYATGQGFAGTPTDTAAELRAADRGDELMPADVTREPTTRAYALYDGERNLHGIYPSFLAAVGALHRVTGQSYDYAARYGGWDIVMEHIDNGRNGQ